MEETIKLTFEQWHRLGFLIIKGSKGTRSYDPFREEPYYYTFTEDQVVKRECLERYREEKWDMASGYPDF